MLAFQVKPILIVFIKKILPVVGVHIKINYNLKHREPYGYNLKDTYTILPVCHQRYILLLPEKIREARHFQGVQKYKLGANGFRQMFSSHRN